MQYPSPYDSPLLSAFPLICHLGRGSGGELASASCWPPSWAPPRTAPGAGRVFGGGKERARRDLKHLWLGKNATGLHVMHSVRDKLVYSQILQESRFCLEPWSLHPCESPTKCECFEL